MRFIYLSFLISTLRSKNVKPVIKSQLTKDSFIGSWVVNEINERKIIHLKENGLIYKSSFSKSNYIGYWETNKNIFYFNLRENNNEKKYYGKIFNNTLNISGNVCEGYTSPNYINNFTMTPLFEQFHNISFVNETDPYTYLNENNVTGKWLLENIHTNNIYLLELHINNTWSSINLNYTNNELSGKWKLYNETNEINTNSAIKYTGKNIWLNLDKPHNQSYITYDIIYLGKIIQLGKIYYLNEDKPSTQNEEIILVSCKINGSVVYGFDMEPEISETFYMKRWFDE